MKIVKMVLKRVNSKVLKMARSSKHEYTVTEEDKLYLTTTCKFSSSLNSIREEERNSH